MVHPVHVYFFIRSTFIAGTQRFKSFYGAEPT